MAIDDGRVVSNFIVQAIRSKPITIYGDGRQTRSFCYVSDLVDGIYKLLMLNTKVEGPINLGNPNEFTMIELAKKIIKLTNSKSKIVYEKLPLDDPRNRRPDISLAIEVLNWAPKVDINEGITLSIEYFRKKIN
jgi:UDP-glucuronate decarboxylase